MTPSYRYRPAVAPPQAFLSLIHIRCEKTQTVSLSRLTKRRSTFPESKTGVRRVGDASFEMNIAGLKTSRLCQTAKILAALGERDLVRRLRSDSGRSEWLDLPVTAPIIVPGAIPAIPGVSVIPRREVPRRWSVIRPAITVRIGRRWIVTPVRVVIAAARVVIHGASGWRSIPPTPIVIILGWRRATPGTPLTIAIAVWVAAGAVAAGWASSIVVVHGRHEWTAARRAGARAISQRHVRLGLIATLGHAQF